MRKLSVLAAPCCDHSGRFSALKAVTLLLISAPAVVLLLRAQAGGLGGRPITEAIHFTGDWTVRLLLLTLAVSPARAVLGWPRVLLLRRMLGVATALYGGLHLALYGMDEKWRLWHIASEIVLRFYLTIGFVALLGLATLAITSTAGWQRRLRLRWKQLHKLVFPLAILAFLHFFLQSKADVSNAAFYAGAFAWLLLWRAAPRRWQGRLALLPLLALGAALATAGIEAGWYGAATKLPALRVLAANLDPGAWRPAWQVALAGLAVLLVAATRRGVGRLRRAPRLRGAVSEA